MARSNGTRAAAQDAEAQAQAAQEQAQAEQASADALAQAAAEAAQAQAAADEAARVAQEQADADKRPSMRAQAQAQTQQATKAAAPLVLAHGCEWHVQPGIGKHGVTVETDTSGTKSRYFLTYVPQIGRVHKVPLLDSFYALVDAGELD